MHSYAFRSYNSLTFLNSYVLVVKRQHRFSVSSLSHLPHFLQGNSPSCAAEPFVATPLFRAVLSGRGLGGAAGAWLTATVGWSRLPSSCFLETSTEPVWERRGWQSGRKSYVRGSSPPTHTDYFSTSPPAYPTLTTQQAIVTAVNHKRAPDMSLTEMFQVTINDLDFRELHFYFVFTHVWQTWQLLRYKHSMHFLFYIDREAWTTWHSHWPVEIVSPCQGCSLASCPLMPPTSCLLPLPFANQISVNPVKDSR